MKVTPLSVLTAVLWSGILIGIVYWMRKRYQYVRRFGISCIVMVYLFCIVRVLFPIDFQFTRGIPMGEVFSGVYRVLWEEKYMVAGVYLSIGSVLCALWIGVSAILLLRFGAEYCSMCRILRNLPVREDEQCTDALGKVFERTGKKHKVTVCKSAEISMPMGIGIRKWRILLPDRMYTDEELYYILLHEYTHFRNGDLAIKILTHIYCCVFWWNPVIRLLKKDLDRSLEIKCDLCITEELSARETAAYLQTIVCSLKVLNKRTKFTGLNGTVFLGDGGENEVVERFRIIRQNKKNGIGNVKYMAVCLSMFMIVMAGSYSFVPQPFYEPPEEQIQTHTGDFEVTAENSYLLHKNGKYYWIVESYSRNEITEELAQELVDSGFEIKKE